MQRRPRCDHLAKRSMSPSDTGGRQRFRRFRCPRGGVVHRVGHGYHGPTRQCGSRELPEREENTMATAIDRNQAIKAPRHPLDETCINTIRTLSMDAVQAAESGHPGTPMAMAPVAYYLWQYVLRFDPEDPVWPNRDRFVLSAGHA